MSIGTKDDFHFGDDSVFNFSQSSVKVTQPPDDNSTSYVLSGLDICLLHWDGQSASSLSIQNVWISDKERPELAQGPIMACTHTPAAHLLPSPVLAGLLIMISGDEFLIANLDRMPSTVPRQIPVSGTPKRLIYAEQQRCLVCASLRYDVRSFPSSLPHAKPEERRQIWPVIDFVPSRSSQASFTHEMQPGERLYALLEWSFRASKDKVYSFILAGGSYTKKDGAQRGRITWLQPINKSWEVVDIKEGQSMKFDAPVYALATLEEHTIVICAGQAVLVHKFSVENRKWEPICTPFKLASPGIYITVSNYHISISTTEDSLVTLSFAAVDREEGNSEHGFHLIPVSMAPRAETLSRSLCAN